jgi:hypothetical protein
MPENYDRYRRFAKRETNPLIDAPVIFLKGMTKAEIMSGVACFIGTIYTSAFSGTVAAAFFLAALLLPGTLKWMRQNLPANAFAHMLWFFGLWNAGLPETLKRPQKSHMTL